MPLVLLHPDVAVWIYSELQSGSVVVDPGVSMGVM